MSLLDLLRNWPMLLGLLFFGTTSYSKPLVGSLHHYVSVADGLRSTVYGTSGEMFCGDIGKPVPCASGATTASGLPFEPKLPSMAVAAPTRLRLAAVYIWVRVESGPCHRVLLSDKMNPRYIGVRGFDLSPAAVRLLTGKPATKHWSGRVFVCSVPYELALH